MRMFTAINKQPWVQTSNGNLTLCRSRSWKFLCTHLTVDESDTLILTSNCTVCSHSVAQWVSNQYWLTDIEQLQSIKLYFSVLTNSIDYKISYLHTHTADTCLSLHHLGYLVVNWSNSDIQTDGQTWAGQICGCKGTKIPPLLQLLAYVFSTQQSCSGSSHWLEDTKNSNGQKCSPLSYFRAISQFFSRTSCLQMSVFT